MDKKIINKEIRKVSNSSSIMVILFLIFVYGMQFLFAYITSILENIGIIISDDVWYLTMYGIQYLIVIPAVLLIFYKTRGKKIGLKLSSCFKKPDISYAQTAKWILITISLTYIANIASNLIFSLISLFSGTELQAAEFEFGDSVLGVFNTIFSVAILAPIFEELFFRATIYRNNEIMGQGFALTITGILFGLWHMNYEQIIFAAVMGAFSCFLFAKTRSIFPCMIVHFCINAIGTIQMLCMTQIDIEKISQESVDYIADNLVPAVFMVLATLLIYALIIGGIILFIIELAKNKRFFTLHKSIFPVSGRHKIFVYFSAPATIILFAFMISLTVVRAIVGF